jgi:hypothetical protein
MGKGEVSLLIGYNKSASILLQKKILFKAVHKTTLNKISNKPLLILKALLPGRAWGLL